MLHGTLHTAYIFTWKRRKGFCNKVQMGTENKHQIIYFIHGWLNPGFYENIWTKLFVDFFLASWVNKSWTERIQCSILNCSQLLGRLNFQEISSFAVYTDVCKTSELNAWNWTNLYLKNTKRISHLKTNSVATATPRPNYTW